MFDQPTDYAGEDLAVVRARDGRAAVIPRSISRLNADALAVFIDLQKAQLQIQQAEDEIGSAVPEARQLGLSWSAIGAALGITGEGARVRFAHLNA